MLPPAPPLPLGKNVVDDIDLLIHWIYATLSLVHTLMLAAAMHLSYVLRYRRRICDNSRVSMIDVGMVGLDLTNASIADGRGWA